MATKSKTKTTEEIIAASKNAEVTLTVTHKPKPHGVFGKATRVVLLAVGVVAVAALARRWLRPGDVYVPEVGSDPEKS